MSTEDIKEEPEKVPPQKVTLVSQEGDSFEVDGKVAMMSELVKTMIGGEAEENGSTGSSEDNDQEIPLPNVKTAVLAKVCHFSLKM